MTHIQYTDECIMKIKSYDCNMEAYDFISTFLLDNQNNDNSSIDLIVEGKMHYNGYSKKGNKSE